MKYDVNYSDSSKYYFPYDNGDPKDRDEKFFLKYHQAAYNEWVNGTSTIGYADTLRIDLNRAYGRGEQPVELYKELLLGKKQEGREKRKAYSNISWEILSVAPKFKSIILAKLMGIDHNIYVDAIDEVSAELKAEKLFELRFKTENKAALKELGLLGENELIPESIEELEMFQEIRGVVLGIETKMEQALDYTWYVSNWPEIKRKVIEDLLDIGTACVKHYTDPVTQKARVKYIDVRNASCQYTRSTNCDKSDYHFVFEDIKAPDLRFQLRKFTNLSNDEIEGVLQKAANYYSDYGTNSRLTNELRYVSDSNCNYNEYTYCLMDLEIRTFDSAKYSKKKNKYSREDLKKQVKDTDNKTVSVKDTVVIYKSKWLVGTDVVYDYGMQYDIPRPTEAEALSSFCWYKVPEKSWVERCKVLFDDIQQTWLDYQFAKASRKLPGIAVDVSTLQHTAVAGASNPLQLVSMYSQTGNLYYVSMNARGNLITQRPPITEIKGGMGQFLYEIFDRFAKAFELISEVSGIDRVSSVSKTPNANTPVGTMVAATNATDNAISPIYMAYINIKEAVAKSSMIRILHIIKDNKKAYGGHYNIFGKTGLQLLNVGLEVLDADFALKIQARPSAKEMESIELRLETAMAGGKNGVPLIEISDYFLIKRMLNNASGLKFAQAFLAFREKQRKKEASQTAQAQIAAQSEAQAAQHTQAMNDEVSLDTAKTKNKIQLAYFTTLFESIKEDQTMQAQAKLALLEQYQAQMLAAQQQAQQQGMTPNSIAQPGMM